MAAGKQWVQKNLLSILIVLGVALGIIVGIIIRVGLGISISKAHAEYLGYSGNLLLRSLKLAATPLIVACILVPLASMSSKIASLSWKILVYVIVTKFVSVGLGIIMTIIIAPGKRGTVVKPESQTIAEPSVVYDVFLDLLRNIIPNNAVEMYVSQYHTILEPKDTSDLFAWKPIPSQRNAINLLGLIFFTILFGFVLSLLKNKGKPFLDVMQSVFDISLVLIRAILWAAPLPLFVLILSEILKITDLSIYASTWGIYLLTTLLCHVIIILVIFPTYLFVFARCNPFKFYADIVQAIIYALATASSLICIPLLLSGLKQNGVDERITSFVIPIVININKDGSAVTLAVAVVTVAQMLGEDLTPGMYMSIFLLCVLGSMATAAVPFAGLVDIIMILNGLGLDQSLTVTIMALYWILDHGNSVVNVIGNGVATKVLYTWNRGLIETLNRIDIEKNEENVITRARL